MDAMFCCPIYKGLCPPLTSSPYSLLLQQLPSITKVSNFLYVYRHVQCIHVPLSGFSLHTQMTTIRFVSFLFAIHFTYIEKSQESGILYQRTSDSTPRLKLATALLFNQPTSLQGSSSTPQKRHTNCCESNHTEPLAYT